MSIRKSMYIKIIILILVPFLLFSLLITGINNRRLESALEDSLHTVAEAQISEMTTFCEQQMNDLTMLGDTDVFHAALRGELDKETLDYLNNLLYSHVDMVDYLDSSTLINKDYQVVACSEPDYELEAHEGFENLTNCIGEEGFYISNVLTSRTGDDERQAVVAIARINDGGETLGYILAEINLDFYSTIRKQAKVWDDSTFYLLDGNGQIISAGTSNDERESFITTKEDRTDFNRKYNAIDFEKNPQGSFTYEVDDQNYITYYATVEYTKWQVMLTANLDHYMARKPIYIVLIVSIILLCLIASIWVGLFTSKRILKPLNNISDTLAQIQREDDYSLRVPVEREDEMGLLAGEVNDLIDFIETENLDKLRKQRILKDQAEHDPLTKVMNKGRIEQYLQDAVKRSKRNRGRIAILFADIDDFKSFNSLYGHSVGDQILQFFAAVLARNVKGAVGRLGGDEFLMVIEDSGEIEKLEFCLERIRKYTTGDFVLRGGDHVPVACCIGAVCVDFAGEGLDNVSVQELVDQADALMYRVKNNGKGGYLIEDYSSTNSISGNSSK